MLQLHASLAIWRNSTGPKSKHVLGTDQYIAPEAYEGQKFFVDRDLGSSPFVRRMWACGILLRAFRISCNKACRQVFTCLRHFCRGGHCLQDFDWWGPQPSQCRRKPTRNPAHDGRLAEVGNRPVRNSLRNHCSACTILHQQVTWPSAE